MKTQEALTVLGESLAETAQFAGRLQEREDQGLKPDQITAALLARTLRRALCAANELEQRAAGNPEPKRGD